MGRFALIVQVQFGNRTQILLHLDTKFHSTDKKEKRNGDEFGVQSKVKEMLFIKSIFKTSHKKKKKKKRSIKTSVFYRSFGTGLHPNLQASRGLWTNGVLEKYRTKLI